MLTASELRQYSYFAGLSGGALEELARSVEEVEVAEGTKLIRQGSPPDYFYFVEKGELEVTKRNRFGQEAKLQVLSRGQGFGETALITCSHRTCSVTTRTGSTLLRLGKKDFERIVVMDSAFKSMQVEAAGAHSSNGNIKLYQPFALLEPEKMLSLADRLVEERYALGDDIVRQGDPPGSYYIIKSGRVDVLKAVKGGAPVRVATLGEGESFGEEGIIREQGRNATVRASEDTVVLALDRKDFNKILKGSYLQFVFPEEIRYDSLGEYVFIDARIPPEHEEEHIEGSVNIPIEFLRSRYAELDPEQEYVTYCTNDSRGMTSAYLLSMNGFKAKCLRGGLSGWEGPITSSGGGVHLPARA
ncbi:MAG: cyclic nucleotide-binding domain-containing protein [Nitrospirae bacterium]|nr:cyclic nucleotide-binding domain-containing protein [Nitrospirota bacterium]